MDSQSSDAVLSRIKDIEDRLRTYLNGRHRFYWRVVDDPVRIKNLEKIAGHLHRIVPFLTDDKSVPGDRGVLPSDNKTRSLSILLDQIKAPKDLCFNSAWELADQLEVELIRLGDDGFLIALLGAELQHIEDTEGTSCDKCQEKFPHTLLKKLQAQYQNWAFEPESRLMARRLLEQIQQARIAEYRRDRAKMGLRGRYLVRMASILGLLLLALWYFYPIVSASPADSKLPYLIAIVMMAGALGSVLSRAIKLSKQQLTGKTSGANVEPPLGIRALMSEWKIFFVQPVIGATAAFATLLVFREGLISVGGVTASVPTFAALIGFLAGFSEPFFLGVLERVQANVE